MKDLQMVMQTALFKFQTDDDNTVYIIDGNELQKGQFGSIDINEPNIRHHYYGSRWAKGLIIVSELLEIQEPYPEVTWIDESPCTWLSQIPVKTKYKHTRNLDGPYAIKSSGINQSNIINSDFIIIVVEWPDGSKPESK